MTLSINQQMLQAPADRHSKEQPKLVSITKVGRVWATTSDGERFDKATLKSDSGLYKYYLSEQEYAEEKALRSAWFVFCHKVYLQSYAPPAGVTIDQMAEALRLVGIEKGD